MSIERYQVTPRISRAVVHNGTVYLCGQVGDDFSAGIKHQTTAMLNKVEELLAEVGSGKECLLSVTIYLANISDFSSMNEAWDEWLPEGNAPARTCIEAKAGHPDILIESTVTAAINSC